MTAPSGPMQTCPACGVGSTPAQHASSGDTNVATYLCPNRHGFTVWWKGASDA